MKGSDRTARRTRWMSSAAIAAALHAGVILACFIHLSTSQRAPEASAIAVELATVAVAPPVPRHCVPPGPNQVQAPRVTQTRDPVFKKPPFEPPPEARLADLKPPVEVAKAEASKTELARPPLPPAPQTTQQAALALAPDHRIAAPNTGGYASGSTKPADLWDARVLARLEALKRYPPVAMSRRQQDVVYARITVDRSGKVSSAKVDHSRGYDLLDSEAIDLIYRASPFPKPPPDVQGDSIEITVPIEFFLAKRGGDHGPSTD
jgi:protein TonB